MKWLFVSLVILISVASLFLLQEKDASPSKVHREEAGLPTFTWSYREYMENEIPRTEVSLTASYGDTHTETFIVDRADGSCNEYEDERESIYEHSKMIICYGAGLGHYYKIVEEGDGYAIQRRVFEEASPDYAPEPEPFVTLMRYERK